MKIKVYDPFNEKARDIEAEHLEFEKVSNTINDIIQRIADKKMCAESAKLLIEGTVKIHGVVASSKDVAPEQLLLPQELNELITETIIAYYEAKIRT